MKTLLLSLLLLGTALAVPASAADLAAPALVPVPPPSTDLFTSKFPPVIVQIGPTTSYSTIICSNFAKLPDGTWKAISPTLFSLGYVEAIVPPIRPIKVGGYIYNNIDLYSQLNAQCTGAVVARY